MKFYLSYLQYSYGVVKMMVLHSRSAVHCSQRLGCPIHELVIVASVVHIMTQASHIQS